ncbi:MAG: phosphatase PAP2 family protein [Actinomycetota bacterium]
MRLRRARTVRKPGIVRPVLRLAAVAVLGAAAAGRLSEHDETARGVVAGRRSELLDRTVPTLTDLGSTYAALGASAALWAGGRRKLARDVLGASMLAWGLAQALKPMFRRPRPYDAGEVDLLVRRPAGQSYPSGHPAVAAAIVTVTRDEVAGPVRPLLERIPRFVAFSRVYVGAHYPTDVIGGLLLGRSAGELWRRFAR